MSANHEAVQVVLAVASARLAMRADSSRDAFLRASADEWDAMRALDALAHRIQKATTKRPMFQEPTP